MLIQTNLELLWAVNPTPEELKGIERHKISDRLWFSGNPLNSPFMAAILAIFAIIGVFALVTLPNKGSTGDLIGSGIMILVVAVGVIWPPVVAYRHSRHITKYWHMKKAGRVIDLRNGFGQILLDNVLFYGDFDLDRKRREKVLAQADPKLIDAFIVEALGNELFLRYMGFGLAAREVLRPALIAQAETVLEAIEPYAAPLRAEQKEEASRHAALFRNEEREVAEVTEARELLRQHGFTAEV
jgi:hypothetical protein